MDKYCFYC